MTDSTTARPAAWRRGDPGAGGTGEGEEDAAVAPGPEAAEPDADMDEPPDPVPEAEGPPPGFPDAPALRRRPGRSAARNTGPHVVGVGCAGLRQQRQFPRQRVHVDPAAQVEVLQHAALPSQRAAGQRSSRAKALVW